MRTRYLIAGLGNPGRKYVKTRHNLGFMAADLLAEALDTSFRRSTCFSTIAETQYSGQDIMIAKPQLYMNRSGEAIGQLVRYFNIDIEHLLIVVDDADLPLGKLRIRKQGSAGGHNGLKSIIAHLGSDVFARLRIGMGRPRQEGEMVNHVLSEFSREEQQLLESSLQRALDACKTFLEQGIDQTMSIYNTL